jgi:hypothetical protein
MLRPEQHLEEFPRAYIPPAERDYNTHMVLTALREDHKRVTQKMNILLNRVGLEHVKKDGTEEDAAFDLLDAEAT